MSDKPEDKLSPLCQAALAAIAMGFAVIPLKVNGKIPVLKNWTKYATKDRAQAIRWWSHPHGNPNYNVGILTGAPYGDDGKLANVLDFDGKNDKPGIEHYRNYKLKGQLNTRIAKTPNGYHAFFLSHRQIQNSVGRIAQGIDVRGWHGYVVAAGSVLADGKRYEWLDPNAPIIDLPEEFEIAATTIAVNEDEERKIVPMFPELAAMLDTPQAIERVINWLINTAPMAIEGKGGDNVTFYVAQRCRAFGVTEPTCLDLMTRYWNNEKADPPWDPDDLAKKVSNAYAYARNPPGHEAPEIVFSPDMAQPAQPPPPPTENDPIEAIAAAAQAANSADAFFGPAPASTSQPQDGALARLLADPEPVPKEEPVDQGEQEATGPKEQPKLLDPRGLINLLKYENLPLPIWEYAIFPWAPVRIVVLSTGHGGIGKTNIEMQKAVAHVMGYEWFGWQCRKGPVLYLSGEDSETALMIRLMLIAEYYNVTLTDLHNNGLRIWPLDATATPPLLCTFDREGRIQPTRFFMLLLEYVTRFKPVNIVIDPLSLFFGGNENDRSHVYQFIALLRQLAAATNGTVTILAHPSKEGLKSGDGYSGSTAWHGAVRARCFLDMPKDNDDGKDRGTRVLRIAKSQYGPPIADLDLVWHKGLYIPKSAVRKQFEEERAEAEFLDRMERRAKQGRPVSDREMARTTYAPSVFAEEMKEENEPDPISQEAFGKAMGRLFGKGKIRKGTYKDVARRVRDCIELVGEEGPESDLLN